MFFQTHYLVIATLVLSLFASSRKTDFTRLPRVHTSAIYQQQKPDTSQEGTVNIQPIAGTTSRGVSAVVVTVDRSRVRVGDTVRFTLSPASLVTNPRYSITIDFGDGTRQQTGRTEIVHRYRAAGYYKVHASVVASERAFGEPDRTVPLQVPRVSLVAPATVVAGRPVTLSAQLTSRYPNLKYRFVFGDTTQTSWQDSSQTTHSYAASGTYLAYVDIATINGGVAKQMGGSVRKPVQVTNAPLGAVELVASPMPTEVGQRVTFNARVVSSDPNIRYRFAFGDGPSGGWQSGPQITHAYSSAGNYAAYVDIGVAGNQGIRQVGSARRLVQVTAAPVGVDLVVDSHSIAIGNAVTFGARTSSTEPNLRYRFFFGDGSPSSGWQDNTQTTHEYAVPGSYPAYVEVGRIKNGTLAKVATSSRTQISVTAAPVTPTPFASPSSSLPPGGSIAIGNTSSPQPFSMPSLFTGRLADDWWKYALLTLLLGFVGYTVFRSLLVSRPTFRAFKDAGGSHIGGGLRDLTINSQVILRPNLSEGEYLVYTEEVDVVKSLRREDG
jgi:hypothetical protein